MDIGLPHGRTVQQLAAGPAAAILDPGRRSAGPGNRAGWGTGWDQLGWGTGHSPPGPESRSYSHSVAVGVAQVLLSLGQILMQTILAPNFFEIFSGRYFSF